MPAEATVIWHEAECGGYAADLPLWQELAGEADGPILELGCGTGRVSLNLARQGHMTLGIDLDASLVSAMNDHAGELPAEAEVGDARDFALGREFGLALGPMQLIQLFAEDEDRLRCLRCVEAHLAPGGIAAFAIVEELPPPHAGTPFRADTRSVEGWVYSSLAVDMAVDDEQILIRRLRQIVAPSGELREEVHEVRLRALSAPALEGEARAAGLRPAGRRLIPPSADHVGSTVLLFGKVS